MNGAFLGLAILSFYFAFQVSNGIRDAVAGESTIAGVFGGLFTYSALGSIWIIAGIVLGIVFLTLAAFYKRRYE